MEEISKLRNLTAFASLNMNTPTIIVHQMTLGMIAHVTEALSRFDINIAQMKGTKNEPRLCA